MGLWSGHDGLDELIAAGYRLPKTKIKDYTDGYKDRPAALDTDSSLIASSRSVRARYPQFSRAAQSTAPKTASRAVKTS